MADLGSIAKLSVLTKPHLTGARCPPTLRTLVCGHTSMVMGGREQVEGSSTPCLRMEARGVWCFRWKVAAGTRTIQVDCKQSVNAVPYPFLRIRANPAIGVNTDVTATAGAGAGWKTIGPATIVPSSDGFVWVELWAPYDGRYQRRNCYWDNLVWT